MRLTLIGIMVLAGAALVVPAPAAAHGGGLNREGCHNERRTGGYHCHRGPRAEGYKARAPRRRARSYRRGRR